MANPATPAGRLTAASALALATGIAVGSALARYAPQVASTLNPGFDALVHAWTNAFRLLVVPLVVAQLFAAICGGQRSVREARTVGIATFSVFVGLLVLAAAISIVGTTAMLRIPGLDSFSLPRPTDVRGAPSAATTDSGASWVDVLVPPNLFAAAASGDLLPLMICAAVFALAARRLAPASADYLRQFAEAVAGAALVVVDWLLVPTPAVIFALACKASSISGMAIGATLFGFTIIESVLMLAAAVVLFPVVWLVGRMPMLTFARAAVPAQVIGATSRSSLAAIPELLATLRTLRGHDTTAPFVIPLAGATLKLSRAVSGPVKLLFIASVLGMHLGAGQIAVFTVTILLLSPSTAGVPRVTSGTRSLPAYVAAGIPPEYVVLLGSTTVLTDTFQTVLNATGYLAAAILVDRFALTQGRDATGPVLTLEPVAGSHSGIGLPR